MCGIVGIVGERDPDALQAMLDSIAHRGPDDVGHEWFESREGSHVGIGNRRLAIIDLSPAGHQPMTAADCTLVYNGEVFNFPSLRAELEDLGETFTSATDTEVVLRGYVRKGLRALEELNGMFALAIWDARNEELVVVRDRFGIKPLYWWWDGRRLVFGSEAKALFESGVPARLNRQELPAYLSFGWVPGSDTLFEGVHELPPGGVLRWRDGRVTVESFRDAVPSPLDDLDAQQAAAELADRLSDSVRRQLIADVPVGVLLSGGLDSSAIAALATRHADRPPKAFSIAFKPEDARTEQSADDARFARLVAGRLGMDLHEFVIDSSIADMLDTVAWHLDEPVADPAAILTLLISRAAKSDVTVLLSGQGSDELFGGYRMHVYDRVARRIARAPAPVRNGAATAIGVLPSIARNIPGPAAGFALAAHRASDAIVRLSPLPPEERYIAFRSAPYFSVDDLGTLLGPGGHSNGFDPHRAHLGAFHKHPELDFFDRMLYVDFKTFMLNQNLLYSDRLSMAASIEMRVPFLDDRVADFALRVPERLKIRFMRGKRVLRDALAGTVPDEVIARRKAGFGAPIRSWLKRDLRPLLEESLSDSWLDETGVFDRSAVRRLIDEHCSDAADHTYRLWTLLSFALWQRAFDVAV
jgi:asparagine synthase (glutamine-hydrolysing)